MRSDPWQRLMCESNVRIPLSRNMIAGAEPVQTMANRQRLSSFDNTDSFGMEKRTLVQSFVYFTQMTS